LSELLVLQSARSILRMTGGCHDHRARRAVLSVDSGRGRENLIECPRPGCPMLSSVVAATWGCGRLDMSYESVVLHVGDHDAATVVLPIPRLRTIYTARQRTQEYTRCHFTFLLYIQYRRIIGIWNARQWIYHTSSDMVSHCNRSSLTSLDVLVGAISNP